MAAQKTKTYTIAQKVTGNEVEVMSLVQLQELVKARIAEGEDPQTVVGFVGLEYEGDMYYGITSERNGTASALEDGLDIRFWWEDEYNETSFKWLWEEPEAKDEKQILASKLLELVAAKGCVEVTTGVYLQTAAKILAEWPANTRFAEAPFWITYDECGLFASPVSGAEDPELVELVAENAEEITKIIESHRTDGIVLCEVDPDTMTFSVAEEAQPQPKKIEPTIIYHHEHPWAVVKTRDGEHSLQVSLTGLSYSEDGKPYLLAWQDTEQDPQELHLYLL